MADEKMTQIDIETIREQINKLDHIGKTDRGGTSRLSYSKAWRQGQAFLIKLMEDAGMTAARDAIGNLTGTYEGTATSLPYIMVGSHLDTVPEGGSLDGALGVIGAIACIRTWKNAGYRPVRTVKVIATVEEEGAVFGLGCLGSRFLAGEMTLENLSSLRDRQGKSLADYFSENDMDYAALAAGGLDAKEIFAFLELHVEQGYELDIAQEACAIVTDIVGIDRHWVTITGQANHAGTTRMDRRRDALAAASQIVQQLYQAACDSNGEYVATIGAFTVKPGATNVIPGQVELTIETRAARDAVMERVHHDILAYLSAAEKKYGVKTCITERRFAPAVNLGTAIVNEFCAAAAELKLQVNKMPSWAGHDAKIMASITKCGMLFVTSLNGISHSPEEDTRWADVAVGLQLFNETLKRVASSELAEDAGE